MAYISSISDPMIIGRPCAIIINPDGCTNWTVTWDCDDLSGTITTHSGNTALTFTLPTTLYEKIPNSTEVGIRFFVYGYYGTTLQDVRYTIEPISVDTSLCRPTISLPTVSEANDAAYALTGDREKLIRYVSSAEIAISAEGKNYATVDETDIEITNNGKVYVGTPQGISPFVSEVFNVKATDSRGLSTSITYTLPSTRIVEYIKLTCNIGNDRQDTAGNMQLTCSGNYFNSSFGAVNNTLTVEYRYKETGGEFGAWTTMSATASGNTYSASADLTGLDYKKTYIFECRATDKAMTISSGEKNKQAFPVFHWSKSDFVHETPVDFRGGILFNGVEGDYIEEQGTYLATSIEWTYRKWHSGLAECWGRANVSIDSGDWSSWGALYQAELLSGESFPFTFTEITNEIATVSSLSGGFVNCSAMYSTYNTTGSYFVVHPNALDDSYQFNLSIHVRGRWK